MEFGLAVWLILPVISCSIPKSTLLNQGNTAPPLSENFPLFSFKYLELLINCSKASDCCAAENVVAFAPDPVE